MARSRLRPSSIVLVTILSLGFLWWQQGDAPAAPPSNDECAAALPLEIGFPLLGNTVNAKNDYTAMTEADQSRQLAASSGGDVVFTVAVPTAESVWVSVKAGFAVSLYASNSSCGTVAIANNDPVASGGPSLALGPGTWSVIVDGWTSRDKGEFTIAASTLTGAMTSADPAAINSMAAELAAVKKKLAATKRTVDRILKEVR